MQRRRYNTAMSIMDAGKELTLKNPAYQKAVQFYVWGAYVEDAGKGDVTTKSFISNPAQSVRAIVVAKESGVLAGLAEAERFLKKVGIKAIRKTSDGSSIHKGQAVMTLSGRADKILAAERTLLNLLQRMSGIATATKKLTSKLPKNIRLLATRKTFWGLLDKKAVSLGGGYTHRLNLADAILIKDNHLALQSDIGAGLKRALSQASKVRFVEVELDSMKEVGGLLRLKLQWPKNFVVMLDNFKPANIKKAAPLLHRAGFTVEVSGGINEKNIKSYCLPGVSAISVGAITNKVPALDISLDIL